MSIAELADAKTTLESRAESLQKKYPQIRIQVFICHPELWEREGVGAVFWVPYNTRYGNRRCVFENGQVRLASLTSAEMDFINSFVVYLARGEFYFDMTDKKSGMFEFLFVPVA